MTDWKTTQEQFRRIAARQGVRKIAEQIPANPVTVYRMLKGETTHPSRAVRAGIERIVADATADGGDTPRPDE